jgi:hypothetical protein
MHVDFNDLPDTRAPRLDARPVEQIVADIAHHEAGHAVVGMYYGMTLARLCVRTVDIDGGTYWTGTTTWNVCTIPSFDLAVEAAAGEAAVRRHLIGGGTPATVAGQLADSPHDRDMAVDVLGRSGYTLALVGAAPDDPKTGTTWSKVTAVADRLVDELWPQISGTAEALLARQPRELDAAEVALLTGIPNGTPSA